MDLVHKILAGMKKGHVTSLYGYIVIRIGDRYIVGESPSIREPGLTIEQAVLQICSK